jgi:hypothetical protein
MSFAVQADWDRMAHEPELMEQDEQLDLAQAFNAPARKAKRTSSERLPACIFVMTLAR